MKKVAIIIHASENEMGRALHGLLYAQELHDAKHDVKLYFDGMGTVWVKLFEDPSHMLNPLYKAVKATGVIAGICQSCASSFGVTEEVVSSGITPLAESEGHLSLEKLIAADYQIMIL
ncbi:DsrE family protein [Paenibacillus spongiae]|uniref:DsrE family protein n=1 Tax=Paenibacillus spongiae TaxID=2909671 RepID=A0ABY5S8M7_9BACL|nr:DsrE family protein [Paenibacillus spongiae]UVI30266.1 DsrE family protein [Paenibacillus spongiae]